MSLEAGTYVGDLVITNPPTTDSKQQGDDHLRLIKSVLKNTFPNATKAFYLPSTSVKSSDYTALATDVNSTILVDTTAVALTFTLPTLTSNEAGWEIFFLKTNTGTNPFFIQPASGTIQSGEIAGLSKTRRSIPGRRTRVLWTGSAWIAERVIGQPVGAVIEFCGTSLPTGYEWPNGQTLSSSANYPDYNSVRGGLTTPDRRGRIAAGKDDMGGTSANRLTNQSGGLNGDTFEATGGSETHTLVSGEVGTHTHTASSVVTDPGHLHTIGIEQTGNFVASGGFNRPSQNNNSNTSTEVTGITVATTVNANSGGGAHNNIQPTIIENFLLVVE